MQDLGGGGGGGGGEGVHKESPHIQQGVSGERCKLPHRPLCSFRNL